MKIIHTKKLLILAMAFLLLFFSACNRRDQYRNPQGTDANEKDSQKDSQMESQTDVESGVDMFIGEGNPYKKTTAEELLSFYRESSARSKLSTDTVIDTPYYYIYRENMSKTGGKAYSKLTGKVVTMCKTIGCDHTTEECVYQGLIRAHFLLDDRIYLLISKLDTTYFLYSCNFMLDDIQKVYEWSYDNCPEDFMPYQDRIYTVGQLPSEDGVAITCSLFVFNPQEKTYTAADDFTFPAGRFIDGLLYYTAQDGALWSYDIETQAHTCLLDASLLNREEGDIRFNAFGMVGENHLSVFIQNVLNAKICYYDLHTGTLISENDLISKEEGSLEAWTQTGQFYLLNHTTTAYESDPHFAYYNDKVENWLVNDSGGEIWYRQNTDDELTLFTVMKTDGIPDAIRAIAAMDGKTMVVTYSSYKDFDNVYNQYQKITEDDLCIRYAVIDLETGAVYKDDLVY